MGNDDPVLIARLQGNYNRIVEIDASVKCLRDERKICEKAMQTCVREICGNDYDEDNSNDDTEVTVEVF